MMGKLEYPNFAGQLRQYTSLNMTYITILSNTMVEQNGKAKTLSLSKRTFTKSETLFNYMHSPRENVIN